MSDNIEIASDPIAQMENTEPVKDLLEELRAGLSDYWQTADSILRQSSVRLHAPDRRNLV